MLPRFALATILAAALVFWGGCSLVGSDAEPVEISISASDAFDGKWTVIELNSKVITADTLRTKIAGVIPPLVLNQTVPAGDYELRITAEGLGSETFDLNTRLHRMVWFSVDPASGKLTVGTSPEIMPIEG